MIKTIKNKAISVLFFIPAVIIHLHMKYMDYRRDMKEKKKREKEIEEMYRDNPQLRRSND